jgi:hypothetical protein
MQKSSVVVTKNTSATSRLNISSKFVISTFTKCVKLLLYSIPEFLYFKTNLRGERRPWKDPEDCNKIMHTWVFDSYHNKTYQFKRVVAKRSGRTANGKAKLQ